MQIIIECVLQTERFNFSYLKFLCWCMANDGRTDHFKWWNDDVSPCTRSNILVPGLLTALKGSQLSHEEIL